MNAAGKWGRRLSISRGYLLLALAVIFILSAFFNWPGKYILVALTVFLIMYSFPFMSMFPKVMTGLLLTAGHVVYFSQPLSFLYWQNSLIENLPLVALFVSVPLFAYPLQAGGYVEYVSSIAHRFLKTPIKIFSNIVVLTGTLSSFMNLGSVRITYELFYEEIQRDPKFYIKSVSQGFSLAMCWSPYFAGVAIVLSMLSLPIFPFILWGVLMMIAGMAAAVLMSLKESHNDVENRVILEAKSNQKEKLSWKKGLELTSVFVGMFASLFILEQIFQVNLVILISFIAFIYPVVWMACLKKKKEFGKSLRHYKDHILPRIHNEAILFIAAAFFAEMVKTTSISIVIADVYEYLTRLSPFIVIFSTILIIVLLGAAGIHQILTVSLIGASISVSDLTISVEAFGLALIAGWSLSTAVSPVAALNLTLGNLLRRSPMAVGWLNVPYAAVTMTVLSVIIYFINYLTI
ncbi:hypothetical protein ACE1TI_15030 [Alteribacillus sp. JSM 102045]|uniref:hypothetical protein n=1 Tax=Alteribacillus sp. JSM 102045 TaxID=1562101 RepID=UPI0035C1B705